MSERDLIRREVSVVLSNLQYLIRLLYSVHNEQTRFLVLHDLSNQAAFLQFLINLLGQERPAMAAGPVALAPMAAGPVAAAPAAGRPALLPQTDLPAITRSELAAANGRGGNPAYVAVSGIVYDVTNHPGWSLATHFGLPAGKDLTAEFGSCHAGQQWILGTLKPVGRLV